jgi:hypothetical protein
MTYYNEQQIEWDTEYVRELYWESKGLGYSNPEPVAKPVFPKFPCWKCGRYGTKSALKIHNEKYPDCDK